VGLHCLVGVLARPYGDDHIAERTIWGNPIVLALVVLGTLMGGDHKVFLAERVLAMLTFERQEVDEEA
jgi:hypothetical protein